MGLFKNLAYTAGQMAGEAKRKRDSADRVNQQDAQTQAYVTNLNNAAQNGDVESMFALGCHYKDGNYVVLDMEKACYWWTLAAERGHVSAQYNLGVLYNGNLSAYYYDENLAGYWWYAAAQNGNRDAQEIIQEEFRYSNFSKKWSKR